MFAYSLHSPANHHLWHLSGFPALSTTTRILGVIMNHHYHIEETLPCMLLSSFDSYIPHAFAVTPALKLKMEPEFTCPALEEHGVFADTLVELEEFLEAGLAFTTGKKAH